MSGSIMTPSPILVRLPSVLLGEVCTYLILNEKAWRFPVLSRDISQAFKPEICCKTDILEINISKDKDDNETLVRKLHQLKYAKFVSLFNIHTHKMFGQVVLDIFAQVRAALESGNLEILNVSGTRDVATMVLEYLLTSQLTGLTKLRNLTLSLKGTSRLYPLFKSDNHGLASCLALQTLVIDSLGTFADAELEATLFDTLPNSLTSLTVRSLHFDVLAKRFVSPSYLPQLQHFEVLWDEHSQMYDDDEDQDTDYLASTCSALSTVMTETGRPRPIESTGIIDASVWTFEWAWCLHTLHLRSNQQHFERFTSQPSFHLPALRNFTIDLFCVQYVQEYPVDISKLIMCLSNKPLEMLIVRFEAHYGECDDPMPDDVTALSPDAILTLSSIRSLKSLIIDTPLAPFEFPRIRIQLVGVDLPGACWPHMTELQIHAGFWTNCKSILSVPLACPKLQKLTVIDPTHAWVKHLCKLAHYCPDLVNISCVASDTTKSCLNRTKQHETSLQELKIEVALYPLTSAHLPHLESVKLTTEEIGVDCFLLLCSVFSVTPQLKRIDVGQRTHVFAANDSCKN